MSTRSFSAFAILIILFSSTSLTQIKNRITIDEKTSKPILIALCDRNAFHDTSFSEWFNNEYDNYNVDTSTVNQIIDDFKQINLTIVFGTWCSDSREQLPRLFKILDFLYYPEDKLRLTAVDRNKKAGDLDLTDLKIELVPTIILYKEDKEIGRIVETPLMSLEEDLVDIIFSSQ